MGKKVPRNPLNPGISGRPLGRRRRIGELLAMYEETAAIQGVAPDQVQIELCKRAAALTFECEEIERRQAKGEAIETGGYVTLVGQLSRVLSKIGIGPKASPLVDADIENPNRPYWDNWADDPLWWTALWESIGNPPCDFYSEGVPSYDEVFPHQKHIEHADGETALEFCARVIWSDRGETPAKLTQHSARSKVLGPRTSASHRTDERTELKR